MMTVRWVIFASLVQSAMCFLRTPFAVSMKRLAALQDIKPEYALLFDCDGVIVETEELHRLAYNKAFEKYGLRLWSSTSSELSVPVVWDLLYYDKLQNTVGGGKPKMKYFFTKDSAMAAGYSDIPNNGLWPYSTLPSYSAPPTTDEAKSALIDQLQDAKTVFYVEAVEKLATARPGVLELMDAAIANPSFKVGICSAATKAGFVTLVNSAVGKTRLDSLDVILAGDDVKNKKPDPEIYDTAKKMIGIDANKCIVIEDSIVGLKAAKAAGMKCIITPTSSTEREDFASLGADAVVSNLADMTIDKIQQFFLFTEAATTVEEVAPIVVESTPIMAEIAPIVIEVSPIVAETDPIAVEAAPIVAETDLIAVEAAPIVAETAVEAAPIVAEIAPIEEPPKVKGWHPSILLTSANNQ